MVGECGADGQAAGGAGAAADRAAAPDPLVAPSLQAGQPDARPDVESAPPVGASADSTERQFLRAEPQLWWFGLALLVAAGLAARPWRLLRRGSRP